MIHAKQLSLPVLQEDQVVSLLEFVVDMLPKLYVKQPKPLKPVILVFGILMFAELRDVQMPPLERPLIPDVIPF
jgi:hypothetical protein